MRRRRSRWLGFALVSGACAVLLALTSMIHAAFAYGEDTAEIMGGSGQPIPPQNYVDAVNGLYIDPATPFPGPTRGR